ncbi:MAG: hypothetical protein CBARDCOR_4785 [uncultured Caballeronia sp.]|nr:MAG: hypothetical protein CBARDCOR_4785 [uncultured Caballeronia sp.]
MSPKLALSALVGALSLSACFCLLRAVRLFYYPAYPPYPGTPVVSTAQTQQEIPVAPVGASGTGYTQSYQGTDNPPSAYASTTTQYFAAPPVVYAPYPAYYGGYGYPAYGYGPSLSVGFGWYGGGGRRHYYRS